MDSVFEKDKGAVKVFMPDIFWSSKCHHCLHWIVCHNTYKFEQQLYVTELACQINEHLC